MFRRLKLLFTGKTRRSQLRDARLSLIDLLEPRQLLSAVTAEFGAFQDTTIYQNDSDASNGAGQFLVTGDGVRSLLKFDVDIPEGSTVLDAVLTLSAGVSSGGSAIVSVHRVSKAWGEGASDAGGDENQGASARAFDATWLYSFFDGEVWQTPGGDFGSASASASVGDPGSYEWVGGGLIDDVQAWVDDASTNFGWLLQLSGSGMKAFLSRDNPDNSLGPILEVTYEPPPGPPAIVEGRLWNDLNGDGLRSDPVLSNLELTIVGGNTFYNVYGGNEYWFRSRADNQWYFLTSDGTLTRWSGQARSLTGDPVTTLDNIYYLQPSLVTQHSPEPEPWLDGWTVELIGSLGNVVQTTQTSGRDMNGDGTIDAATEGGWYRFVVDGDETYSVRQVIPAGWSELVRLELESSNPSEQAVNLLELEFRTSYYLNFGGLNEKWMYSQQSGWYYITPDGNLYHWNGRAVTEAAPLTGTLITSVGVAAYADPAAAFSGQFSGGSSDEPPLTRVDFGNVQSQTVRGRAWLDFFDNGLRDTVELIPDYYVVYPTEPLGAGEEWFYDYNNDDWYVINVDGEARYFGKWNPDSDDFTRPGPGGSQLTFVETETEPWLNNRTVQLIDRNGAIVATTTTRSIDLNGDGTIQYEDERGWYVFEDVPYGDYTIQMVTDEGWLQTAPVGATQANAIALDQELNFVVTGNNFQNWGGTNERWLKDQQNRWYYIQPDGSLYRWQVGSFATNGGLKGSLMGTLSSTYYDDLSLLASPDLVPLSVHVDKDGTSEDLLFGSHRLLSDLLLAAGT
ncbi:MAG: DNRLRE domain-containing protein [Planctomycetaceae bacterium]